MENKDNKDNNKQEFMRQVNERLRQAGFQVFDEKNNN
jgi:predicted methyltransferase